MRTPSIVLCVIVASLAVPATGCNKKKDSEEQPAAKKPAPPPPPAPKPPPPPPRPDLPFAGTYTKYAEATWKNGQRVRVSNATGVATLVIDHNKVTYAQTYTARGKKNSVTQIYSFASGDVKPVNGGYDVTMVFQSISGDTQSYSPDKNRPRIEARKQAGGWEIGLLTTDNNGVMGGVEFK